MNMRFSEEMSNFIMPTITSIVYKLAYIIWHIITSQSTTLTARPYYSNFVNLLYKSKQCVIPIGRTMKNLIKEVTE